MGLASTWPAAVAALVTAATVPRLAIDYGYHTDATRSAKAAHDLAMTGAYRPLRTPGNPLFDLLLTVPQTLGGALASNLFVLGFYLLALAAFWQLVRERPHGRLLLATFALTPMVLVNAATTIDHVPATALLLLAYACTTRGRPFLGSIVLGLAIGFRLAAGFFLLPSGLYLLARGASRARVAACAALALEIGLVWYVPIFLQRGVRMFATGTSFPDLTTFVLQGGYYAIWALGPLATLGIAALLALQVRTVAGRLADALRADRAAVIAEGVAVVGFAALFVAHPAKAEYLLPAVPFFLLLLGRLLNRWQLVLVGVLIASFGVVTVDLLGGVSGKRALDLRLAPGIVVQDYLDRHDLERLRGAVAAVPVPERSVVMTGMGPELTFDNAALRSIDYRAISDRLDPAGVSEIENVQAVAGRQVYLVYSLSEANVGVLEGEGYGVFMFSEAAPAVTRGSYRYDPYARGIPLVHVLDERAFYRAAR